MRSLSRREELADTRIDPARSIQFQHWPILEQTPPVAPAALAAILQYYLDGAPFFALAVDSVVMVESGIRRPLLCPNVFTRLLCILCSIFCTLC